MVYLYADTGAPKTCRTYPLFFLFFYGIKRKGFQRGFCLTLADCLKGFKNPRDNPRLLGPHGGQRGK